MSTYRYRGLAPTRRENSVYLQNVAYGYGDAGDSVVSSGDRVAGSSTYTPQAVAAGGAPINLLLHPDDHAALMKSPKLFTIPFDPMVFVNSGLMPKAEGFVPPEYEKDYLLLCIEILQAFRYIIGQNAWSDALVKNQVGGIYLALPGGVANAKVNPAFARFLWYGLLGTGGIEQANQLAVNGAALKKIIDDRIAEITSYIQQIEVTIQTLIQTALIEQQQQQAAASAAAAQDPTQVDTIGPQTSTEEGPVPGEFVPPSSAATAPTQAPPSLPADPELPAVDSSPSYLPWELGDRVPPPGYVAENEGSLPAPTLPAVLPEEEEKWYDKTENQVALGLGLLAAGYAIYKWSK